MSYNPTILRDMLRARSITRGQLRQRLGLDRSEFDRQIDRDPEPTQNILNKIARELALPSFVFYMQRLPALHDVIPDFRAEAPVATAKDRETIEAIQFAEGVQRAADQCNTVGISTPLPSFAAKTFKGVDQFAKTAREFFDISVEEQKEAKDARAFYLICRKKIEDKGIFVLHASFPENDGSGFCLSDLEHPVVVVNTRKQTPGRRLFTLIHELAHVLLKQTGISDPAITQNTIERNCNRFAGSFLVPGDYLNALLGNTAPSKSPDLNEVARISRKLKISQEATVVRLEQLGVFSEGSHGRWLRMISGVGNPDTTVKKGGPPNGPPPQEKVKLAKYGFHFARAFAPVLEQGVISEINLFRSSGLKPKYQRSYFQYARSLTPIDLRDLELDDE